MAHPTWPATLPQLSDRDGYEGQYPEGRVHSQTDVGPGKFRSRYTLVPEPVKLTFLMDYTQLQALRTFLESDLAKATRVFYMPNQLDPGGSPWIVQIPKDSMPSWRPRGIKFDVTLNLVIMP